jgi:hypothetical protein
LFLPAIVFGWTASAVLARIERSKGGRPFALVLAIGASAVLFVDTAIDAAQSDKFARPADIQWAEMHPGARWVPSMPRRAASILDCLAGPGDSVDFHSGHDSWIYPAFGAKLTRDVRFIRHAAEIRPDVQWVAVDRAYNVIWKHPDFKDISQWDRYLGRGIATREDREVLEALLDDRRFKLEFYDRREVQAVFRRLPAPAATAPRGQLDRLVFESPDLGACPASRR